MARSLYPVLMATLFAMPTAQAKSAEPLVLEPSSPWNLDYGENMCSLRRAFGTGDQQVVLDITKSMPGVVMGVKLAGAPLRSAMRARTVGIGFGPKVLGLRTSDVYTGETSDGSPAIGIQNVGLSSRWIPPFPSPNDRSATKAETWQYPTSDEVEQVSGSANGLYVQLADRTIDLRTGPLRAGIAALDKCVTEQLQSWGIDPEALRNQLLPPMPSNNPSFWATNLDWRANLMPAGKHVVVGFRLEIGTEGQVERCLPQGEPVEERLSSYTCGLMMKRAKFYPARNAAGKPMRSLYISNVRWANYNRS